MGGEHDGYGGQVAVGVAVLHHERHQPGVVVVDMDHVEPVRPPRDPVDHGNLEGHEALRVVVVPVDPVAVEESVDIDQVEFEAQPVGPLADDGVFEAGRAQRGTALVHDIPVVLVQELRAVHGHDHLGRVPGFALVAWQRADDVAEPAGLGHRIAFRCDMDDFHGRTRER